MPADFSQVLTLAQRIRQLSKPTKAAVRKTVVVTTRAARATARSNAPVDQGVLRKSITGRTRGLTGTVTATAPYAAFVEYGTARTDPQPFMDPAAQRHAPGFYKATEDAVVSATDGAVR